LLLFQSLALDSPLYAALQSFLVLEAFFLSSTAIPVEQLPERWGVQLICEFCHSLFRTHILVVPRLYLSSHRLRGRVLAAGNMVFRRVGVANDGAGCEDG
jgi:hypothetical protein